MKSGTALVIKLLGGVVLLISSLVIVVFALDWWSNYSFDHNAPIAALSVRNTDDATESAFRRSVQATFRLGLAVDDMRKSLSAQGFRDRSGQYRPGPALVLEINRGLVCDYFWEVFWTSSSAGTLTSVDAALNRRRL